jgi:cytochrome oxidase Cu insertion factor (SCO1/SenC/PrrC family)
MKILLINLFFLFIPFCLYAQTEDTLQQRLLEELMIKRDSIIRTAPGKPFLPFSATSLEGVHFSEQQLKGKVTMVNFWYRACHPCIEEIPLLNDLYTELKDNPSFQFISFTFDPEDVAKQAVEKYNISFTVLPITLQECYQLIFNQGFPTNMIVDKDGKIALYISGEIKDKDKENMIIKIKQLLEQN